MSFTRIDHLLSLKGLIVETFQESSTPIFAYKPFLFNKILRSFVNKCSLFLDVRRNVSIVSVLKLLVEDRLPFCCPESHLKVKVSLGKKTKKKEAKGKGKQDRLSESLLFFHDVIVTQTGKHDADVLFNETSSPTNLNTIE